jgi:peptidoglycan/xylan/chitin deacetylase (PgdA/CDA1 family)
MFFDQDLKGDLLPTKTCCLTYDDGPGETEGDGAGPKTRRLGELLHDLGVTAAFFCVGRHVEQHPDLVRQLSASGHFIGNHTYRHPGLASLADQPLLIAEELLRTDEAIQALAPAPITFLRPPYGNWRDVNAASGQDHPRSRVAEIANRLPLASRYYGPVNWDLCAEDWNFWHRGDAPEDCAAAYLQEVERKGRGILLMHDSSADDSQARVGNRAFETTALLVPELLGRGYRFIGLDEIPQIQSAMRVVEQVTFELDHSTGVLRCLDNTLELTTGRAAEVFGVIPLGSGATAFRTANGCLLSADPSNGSLTASATAIGVHERFREVSSGNDWIRLQAPGGDFIGHGTGCKTLRLVRVAQSVELRRVRRFA